MVYESDFYTTRRPYSSRPNISSYSVTRREVPWHKVPDVPRPSQVPPCFTVFGSRSVPDGMRTPGLGKGQTFHRHVPAIGHKRIVVIAPSAHVVRSRPSALIGEYDRIYHRVRPSLAYQPTEDYLNSRSIVSFDDETRSIRAQTADLLKKIHTPVPRAQRPLPLPGDALELVEQPADWYDWYDWYPEELGQTRLRLKLLSLKRDLSELGTGHSELPITDRITSDTYIDRLLSGTRNVARDINIMSHYEEPARHCNNIGQGHLACMSFARGRPISKRRNLAEGDDYVRNDINMLSHYGRLRAAANAAATAPTEPAYEPSLHRPPTKSAVTGSWKSNAPRNAGNQNKSSNLTAGDEFDAAQDRKQRRRDAVEAAAQREVGEEKRRKDEVSRQEDLAQQAIIAREQEIERKAREEQEAAQRKEEEDRLEAERLAQEEKERLAAEELRLLEEEEARKKQEEEEKKAKKAKKEAEKKAKEEAERKAKEEEEKRAKEEADRKAKEDEERKAREEAEKIAREEEERKAQEEAERLALEEQERRNKEEAERLALEEEERRNKEEAERLALQEEERRKEEEEAEKIANEERLAAEVVETEGVAQPADSGVDTEGEPASTDQQQEVQEATEEPVVEEPNEDDAVDEAPADEAAEEDAEDEEE